MGVLNREFKMKNMELGKEIPYLLFLFLLVGDVFNRMLEAAVANEVYDGIPVGNAIMSHLQFADDT